MIKKQLTTSGDVIFEYEGPEGKSFLSSKYDPKQEAERIFEDQEKEGVHLVFLFGSGNLSLIRKISSEFREIPFALVEKAEIAEITLKELTQAEKERVILLSEGNFLQDLESLFISFPAARVKFFYNRSSLRLFNDYYEKARAEIVRLHDKKSINRNTLGRFEHLWLRNIMRNTASIIKAGKVSDLIGVGKNKKAILVAAGPSLAKDLPLVKEYQDQVMIVAVDTTYKTLLRHGIRPDIVVVVDPQKVNSRYVENMPQDVSENTIIVAEPAVTPHALKASRDQLFMFDTIFPFYALLTSFFGKKGELDMGGSVATTGFDLCLKMQFDKVMILGLDLSFSKDSYHVPGTLYEEFWFSSIRRFQTLEMLNHKLLDYDNLQKVQDIHGQSVFLDAKFTLFKNWFENKLLHPEVAARFVGSLSGGIPLQNLARYELKDFLKTDSLLTHALKEQFRTELKQLATKVPVEFSAQKQDFKKSVLTRITSLDKILLITQDAIRTALQLSKKLRMKQDGSSLTRRLDECDQKLSEDFLGKDLVNIALQSVVYKIEEDRDSDHSHGTLEHPKAILDSLGLYQGMAEAIQLNLRFLKKIDI